MVIQKSSSQIVQTKVRTLRNSVNPTKRKITILKNEINQYFDNTGYLSWSSKKKMYVILGTNSPKNGLVDCPECNIGQLMVIRPNKTKKRFIGCSNYYNGCKASSPLFQKAKLRATKIRCEFCSWPIIFFRYTRRQKWVRRCSNISCKAKSAKS